MACRPGACRIMRRATRRNSRSVTRTGCTRASCKSTASFATPAADKSRHAGIPSSDICMKCHQFVTSSFDVLQHERTQADAEKRAPKQMVSAELRKLYDSFGLDESLKPIPNATPTSIPWVRVHNLPDYVYFRPSCSRFGGHHLPTLSRLGRIDGASPPGRRVLSMGWCVNCHRETTEIDGKAVRASTDCAACHY